MKLLIVALLLFSLSATAVFAQDQLDDPWKAFSRWIQMVKDAEQTYKNRNGHYGDLATLRKAHLLDELVSRPALRHLQRARQMRISYANRPSLK